MKSLTRVFALTLGLGLLQPLASGAVVLGQTDNFESGTTQNWVVGIGGVGTHPSPPVNVASGGPAGAGDNFLSLTAVGGAGPGSKLSVLNFQHQWGGNYIAAGITGIAMDVNNLGATALKLRLLFEDPVAGPPTNEAFSVDPIDVQPGSGWQHIVFPIAPADLEAGLGTVLAALTGATTLRIFHGASPAVPGESIVALLGVDNITAVPEPQTWIALAVALGMFGLTRVRVRTH